MSGCTLSALLVMSLAQEGVVLHLHVLDHNLLWFLGILTALYTGCTAYEAEEKRRATYQQQNHNYTQQGQSSAATGSFGGSPRASLDMDRVEWLRQLCRDTHYMSPHWLPPPPVPVSDSVGGDGRNDRGWNREHDGGRGRGSNIHKRHTEGDSTIVKSELEALLPHKASLFIRELLVLLITPLLLAQVCRGWKKMWDVALYHVCIS